MSVLTLKMFGQMESRLPSGTPLSLTTRKADVLLAYLALTPGLRHPRERLVNLLWSDRSEEQARNSLRQCLSAIKKSLGEASDTILQVDRTTVSLNPELIDADVHEFERLAGEADYDSLAAAASLYDGEFLEGISIRDAACQEWLDGERSRFKRQFIEILTRLGQNLLEARDFGAAIKSAEGLVDQDPLCEAGWRLLMSGYFENGDRNHALMAFKRCSDVLQKELGVEPEATTIELRDQIRSGKIGQSSEIADKAGAAVKSPAKQMGSLGETSKENTILVLPLKNLSNDPEQQYFSDGLTESIIMGLSMFPSLRVRSRSSTYAASDQQLSTQQIGDKFNALYLVEGSVRRSKERIRVNAQLVNTQNGEQIWSNRFDDKREDTFELEDQLTRSIVAAIKGKIEATDENIAIRKQARDIQSYDLLLQGYHHLYKFNPEDNARSIELLNQCIEIDDENALAHNHLYQAYYTNWLSGWSEPRAEILKKAEFHIKRALDLAPDNALVQADYAESSWPFGDIDDFENHAEHALRLNPNDPEVLATVGAAYAWVGNIEKGMELIDSCYQLAPFHPWIDWVAGAAYYLAKRYEDALRTFKNMPNPVDEIDGWIAACYQHLGDSRKARKHLELYLETAQRNMAQVPASLGEWALHIEGWAGSEVENHTNNPFDALCEVGLEELIQPGAGVSKHDRAHSIAVLPFDNLSGDPEQEYFSDGITDSIILNLSLFPVLHVKSRNSSFAFKQQIKGLGEISRELEVDYLIEGSIRKSDQRIRITVQLIEAESGNQVWGKRYDSDLADLFTLEEVLSRTIAATVTGQIDSDLQRIAIAKGAAHQESYDLLLSGRYHVLRFNGPDTVIGIDKLNQCLAQDPNNVHAHALLYYAHCMNWQERWVEDLEPSFELAGEHARKALALGSESGIVQVAYAEYLIFCREYDKAAVHIDKALAINPNDADALATRSFCLVAQGDYESALEVAEIGCRLDPYHPWCDWALAEAQFFTGRYKDTLHTISISKNPPGFIRIFNVAASIKLGKMNQAREALQEFIKAARQDMFAMPKTREEWVTYTTNNAPYQDRQLNEELIDYLVQAGLDEELASISPSESPDQHPTILVLPFSNLSGDPEQEYFSDGITESIILNLSLFNGLNIKSRHTSFAFKDSSKSIEEIGDDLGIQYIVEGSIRNFGDKVRITVQLADIDRGNQLWGKRFDSALEELFSLEEELVQTIAGTISGRIGKDIKRASLRKPAKDLKSYDYLMRGLYHLEKFSVKDNFIARDQLQKCLEHDPDNPEAHAFIAASHITDLYDNWSEDRALSRKLCKQHVEKALSLEPDNAYAHAFMAESLMLSKDFDQAALHVDKAIELNPTLPDGYSLKAYLMGSTRRYDEAVENADISMQIDPYHPYAGWNAGEVYRVIGEYDKAVKTFRLVPNLPPSLHGQIAASLAGLGLLDEARAEIELYHQLAHEQMPNYPTSEEEWRTIWDETMPYLYQEDTNDFFDLLLKAGLCDHITGESDDLPSIAVLPFENMSGDPEQEYFSDGITNDIVTTLSHIRRLRVVARHSTLAYKEHKPTIAKIAEEQGVRYILDGSVRKSGKRIRVNVQLIDSSTGENCWAENYDRDLRDIFALQDEITKNIAVEMQVHLLSGDSARETSMGTRNIKAWELVSMAWDLQDSYIKDNMLKARRQVDKALQLDPEYSTAWVVLGWTHWQAAYVGFSESIDDSIREAENAVDKALSIDPENAEALALRGFCHVTRNAPDLAVETCSKAVEISPGNAEVQALTAFVLVYAGEYDKALPHHEASLRLCPICPNWFQLVGGAIYHHTGNLDKAIAMIRKGVEIEPESPLCRYYLVDALMDAGREKEARACADEIRALDSAFSISGMLLNYSHNMDIREGFRANLEKVGIEEFRA